MGIIKGNQMMKVLQEIYKHKVHQPCECDVGGAMISCKPNVPKHKKTKNVKVR